MAVATAKPNTGGGSAPAPTASNNAPAANPVMDAVSQYRWFILAGLWAAAVMEVLDTTIVNVALPQMSGNLGATTQEIAWVSTGYILANVVILPMTAFLAERFGRKNYLMFSIILFVLSSFLCGISHSLGELVLWRIMQGAGGAALALHRSGNPAPDLPADSSKVSCRPSSCSVSLSPRHSARHSVAGSQTTTPGAGVSSSTFQLVCCRFYW